ncbi:hypothetical protein UMC2_26411 [[Clostridium] sordellii]|uniref:hypothetical protein n=1 Tax=Paraclostridium sordellii TaxID=1505 RepID=UPI000541B654|nr:hypothetical protein [Paeniclostridium sordellii]CEK35748.1 hypothetical protein UMC2_26411 [[Clostridium] sordellii] [Paeniclostridium sordellii]
MAYIIKELLPYVKTFAWIYIALYVIGGTLAIVFTVWIFKTSIRKRRKFEKIWKR